MKIETYTVKQYSSKTVTVICVDGKPFCTARGSRTISNIIARLNGYNVELRDGRMQKHIDDYIGIRK